jgi:hypothetical protein
VDCTPRQPTELSSAASFDPETILASVTNPDAAVNTLVVVSTMLYALQQRVHRQAALAIGQPLGQKAARSAHMAQKAPHCERTCAGMVSAGCGQLGSTLHPDCSATQSRPLGLSRCARRKDNNGILLLSVGIVRAPWRRSDTGTSGRILVRRFSPTGQLKRHDSNTVLAPIPAQWFQIQESTPKNGGFQVVVGTTVILLQRAVCGW